MVNPRDLFGKAKGLANQHSDKVRDAIDKAEDMVDQRTGGKHGDKVGKAGDFIEDKLGIRQPGDGTPPVDRPGDRTPPVDRPGDRTPPVDRPGEPPR